MTLNLKNPKIKALFRLMAAGAIAGAGFNLAFGAAAWHVEGILGGAVSGLLIFVIS